MWQIGENSQVMSLTVMDHHEQLREREKPRIGLERK